jgi:hypothetical protein
VPARNWPGVYFSNDGQLLYARDAKRLADVLEKVIVAPSAFSLDSARPRLSRWFRTPEGRQAQQTMGVFGRLERVLTGSDSPKRPESAGARELWLLTDDGKSCLRDFIKFCRGGSFRIY